MALAIIAADVAVVLAAAYILSTTAALIVAAVLGILFARWWQRSSM